MDGSSDLSSDSLVEIGKSGAGRPLPRNVGGSHAEKPDRGSLPLLLSAISAGAVPRVYRRHRPETTALYEVVRDNLETLLGAIDDGALAVRIPRHARKELLAYLDCGLLCRGFARLKCRGCNETRLVAFSCKGRGFCPSPVGADLPVPMEAKARPGARSLPLGHGELLGRLTQILVDAVQAFYVRRAALAGRAAQAGSMPRVERPCFDMSCGLRSRKSVRKSGYRPWAELLQRTFLVDVVNCPSCQGRMRLLAVVKNPAGIARYLAALGELTEVPGRSPPRALPYWKSRVLKRQALGDQGEGGDDRTDHEAA